MALTAEAINGVVGRQTRSTLRSALDSVEDAFATSGVPGGKESELCLKVKAIIKDRVNRGSDAMQVRIAEMSR